jgi:hypothetical protein
MKNAVTRRESRAEVARAEMRLATGAGKTVGMMERSVKGI